MSLHDQRIPFHISMHVTVNTHVKGSKKMFCTSSSFMLWCLNVFLFLISLKRFHIFWPFTISDHFASWYWHGSVWCSPIYFQRTREYSPQDILVFAYYRSLLQSTITIFGGTHRHAHTNTHAISRRFALDFVHRHNGLRSEACVCSGALCSVHSASPSLLASSISKQAAHHSENWVLYPASSYCRCLEETFYLTLIWYQF